MPNHLYRKHLGPEHQVGNIYLWCIALNRTFLQKFVHSASWCICISPFHDIGFHKLVKPLSCPFWFSFSIQNHRTLWTSQVLVHQRTVVVSSIHLVNKQFSRKGTKSWMSLQDERFLIITLSFPESKQKTCLNTQYKNIHRPLFIHCHRRSLFGFA